MESHESRCGILSNLAIHVWVCVCNECWCWYEIGRKESSREAQLPVGVVLLALGVGFQYPDFQRVRVSIGGCVITKRVCAASSNRIASKRVWSRTACEYQAKGMRNQCRSGGGGGVMSTGVLVASGWCLGPGQIVTTDNSGCRLQESNTNAGNGAGLPREACLRRMSPTVWRTGRGGQRISLKRART